MHFLITARYSVDAAASARRQAVEAEHRQGILQLAAKGNVIDGGLLLDDHGRPTGSLLIVHFSDRSGLNAYLAREPYVREQVWETMTVLAFHRLDAQSLQAGSPDQDGRPGLAVEWIIPLKSALEPLSAGNANIDLQSYAGHRSDNVKILVTSTAMTGHVSPVLSATRMLVRRGHDVLALNARANRATFEAAGARFEPFPGHLDCDYTDTNTVFPGRTKLAPGPEMLEFDFTHVFLGNLSAQHDALTRVLQRFPADLILCDDLFLGTLPMLTGPRKDRPAIVHLGITFLCAHRDDGAPAGLGLPPASHQMERAHYGKINEAVCQQLFDPIQRRLDSILEALGRGPLALPLFDAISALPDLYLQPTIPGFEYPRSDLTPSVRFIGAMPLPPSMTALPDWADEVDGSRHAILVTQGTLANHDFSQLVEPTLQALADRMDVLVLVTTGGRPVGSVSRPLPSNARLARFLPFDWLMPKLTAVVTNGGYGTVNLALSHGVPIVVAGLTEDKAEVAARIAWSQSGINLSSNMPTAAALREAVEAVLTDGSYRTHAQSLSRQYARLDAESEVVRLLEGLVPRAREADSPCLN